MLDEFPPALGADLSGGDGLGDAGEFDLCNGELGNVGAVLDEDLDVAPGVLDGGEQPNVTGASGRSAVSGFVGFDDVVAASETAAEVRHHGSLDVIVGLIAQIHVRVDRGDHVSERSPQIPHLVVSVTTLGTASGSGDAFEHRDGGRHQDGSGVGVATLVES